MGIFDMFSNKNEKKGRDEQIRGLRRGRDEAFKYLGAGEGELRGRYGEADDFFEPLSDTYGRGSRAYAEALGLYGDEGIDAARGRFRAGPGYEFQQEEAAQRALRQGSAMGMLGSGNTAIALQDRASSLADQEYDDYLDRLGGYDSKAMGVAGSRAGIATGLGDRLMDVNRDRSEIGWNTETGVGQARGNYQLGKDRTSSNIFGALTGGLKLGTKLLGL